MVVDLIFDLIGDLRRDGVTILLVEQNVDRTLEIADRGYVLGSGELRLTGPAASFAPRAASSARTSASGPTDGARRPAVHQRSQPRGVYALLALGLAMVFSIMGMVNFAHGES